MSMDEHACYHWVFFPFEKNSKNKRVFINVDIQTLVHNFITSNWIILTLYYTDCLNFLLIGYKMCKTVLLVRQQGAKLGSYYSINELPISQCIIYKIVLITYKSLNGLTPHYINNMLN